MIEKSALKRVLDLFAENLTLTNRNVFIGLSHFVLKENNNTIKFNEW